MTFSLLPITEPQLRQIAACGVPPELSDRLEPNALPPAFVAQRALQMLEHGHAEVWSCSYLIVREMDARIVGGCGFKIAPRGGRVEIGYAVSPESRGQGAATEAVRQLMDIAFSAGAKTIAAEISPENHASIRVVQKLGFAAIGSRVDEEGEQVVQWAVASGA